RHPSLCCNAPDAVEEPPRSENAVRSISTGDHWHRAALAHLSLRTYSSGGKQAHSCTWSRSTDSCIVCDLGRYAPAFADRIADHPRYPCNERAAATGSRQHNRNDRGSTSLRLCQDTRSRFSESGPHHVLWSWPDQSRSPGRAGWDVGTADPVPLHSTDIR